MIKQGFGVALLLIVVSGIGFPGYSVPYGWSYDGKAFKNISADQFARMMTEKDFTLINVHIPYQGEIGQTDLSIPFNAIDRNRDKLPENKDAEIVVYCLGGHMGAIAAEKLADLGYSNVLNLRGGMMAWKRIGKTIQYRSE